MFILVYVLLFGSIKHLSYLFMTRLDMNVLVNTTVG